MKNLHQSNNFYRIFSLAKTVRSLGKPFYIIANQWRNITYRLRTFFYTKNCYDNKLVTHLFLIFFFPIGLYALWKSHTITKWWKISASLLLAFLLTSIGFRTLVEDASLMHFKSIEEMSYLNLTQAQKDSVESVRKIEAEKRQRAKEEKDNIIKKLKKIAESDWPNAYRI